MEFDKKVSDYIQQAPEEQIALLDELRLLIHKAVPGTTEAIKWGFPVFTKVKNYAYIRSAKKHITLGFYNTERIDDPDNLLEGTGKALMHIKIRKQEDIKVQLLTKWLKAIAE